MIKKVLIAMSGGVDSTVAAILLKQEGYHVEGATIELENAADSEQVSQAVLSGWQAAHELGIKHYIFNFKEQFDRYVKADFKSEYTLGRTPNPCVRCNKYIKFGAFFEKAMQMGFDYVATGHYAKVLKEEDGTHALYKSSADKKDQTYVLYNLNQDILSHLLMPLGEYNKSDIRDIAQKHGVSCAKSKDSVEICFIPDNDHFRYLTENGVSAVEGAFIDSSGEVLGRHKGIVRYTVGQRKGLGMSFGEPKYVLNIDHATNRVTLGSNEMLFNDRITVDSVNWLTGKEPQYPLNISAKIRYSATEATATVNKLENGDYEVLFSEKQRAATPGQSVVFYDGERLLGGGVIKR